MCSVGISLPSPLSINDNSSDAVPSQDSLSFIRPINSLANLGIALDSFGDVMTIEQDFVAILESP